MKQIKLLFLLASASVTGAFAQSNGLTDMSQSRYAKMANTGIDAVHWTNGFWGERFNVFSGTSLQSMWNTWNTPEVSHGFRNFEIAAGVCKGEHWGGLRSMMEICTSGWKESLLCMLSIKIRNWTS